MEAEGPMKKNIGSLWESFVDIVDRFDEQFHLREKVYVAREWAYEHPVWTLFILVALGMSSIPVIGFICFVISTVLLAFLGFMFFEGSILIFGTLILGGILCFTGIVSVAFSSCLVLSYLAFNASFGFFSKFRGKVGTCYQQYTPECVSGVKWRVGSNKEE